MTLNPAARDGILGVTIIFGFLTIAALWKGLYPQAVLIFTQGTLLGGLLGYLLK